MEVLSINQDIWPNKNIVYSTYGSLPMGGVVEQTPIYAFDETPQQLVFSDDRHYLASREEIDLGGKLAFMIHNVASDEECDHLIMASETFGYRDEAPGISTPPGMRMNKTVHWLADDKMLGPLMRRMKHLLPQQIQGRRLFPRLSHRLNMYRYDQNDVFNQHIDGDWPGFGLDASRQHMLEWQGGMRSCLTMILYLNGIEDGVQGGNTLLLSQDQRWVSVTPKKGSALFFRHGFGTDSVVHIGARVTSHQAKYIARVNVLYQ